MGSIIAKATTCWTDPQQLRGIVPAEVAAAKMESLIEVHQLKINTKQIERDTAVAQAKAYFKVGNKSKAAQHMRKVKTYEGNIRNLQGRMVNLQSQLEASTDIELSVQTVKALKANKEAMESTFSDQNLRDDAGAIMDGLQELHDDTDEIRTRLAIPLGVPHDFDMDMTDEQLLLELSQIGEIEEGENFRFGVSEFPTDNPEVMEHMRRSSQGLRSSSTTPVSSKRKKKSKNKGTHVRDREADVTKILTEETRK